MFLGFVVTISSSPSLQSHCVRFLRIYIKNTAFFEFWRPLTLLPHFKAFVWNLIAKSHNNTFMVYNATLKNTIILSISFVGCEYQSPRIFMQTKLAVKKWPKFVIPSGCLMSRRKKIVYSFSSFYVCMSFHGKAFETE